MKNFSTAILLLVLALLPYAYSYGANDRPPRVDVPKEEQKLWAAKSIGEEEAGEWKYYGFTPEEARTWKDADIPYAGWADQWKSEQFSPKEAKEWKVINVYTARDFKEAKFTPTESLVWINLGIRSGKRAAEFRFHGFTPEEAALWWNEKFFPLDAKEWRDAGLTPKQALTWKYKKAGEYSAIVYSAAESKDWKEAGFSVEEMRGFKDSRFTLKEASEWKAAGFDAIASAMWKDSGKTVTEAATLSASGIRPSKIALEKMRTEPGPRITSLKSDVTLRPDSMLSVRQSFIVTVLPEETYSLEINFPRSSEIRDIYGNYSHRQSIYGAVLLHMDGKSIEPSLEKTGGLNKLKLPAVKGEHTYTLFYTVDNRITRRKDHDELYMDANSHLPFPIEDARISIALPKNVSIVSVDGHLGERKFAEVNITDAAHANLDSTYPIEKGKVFGAAISITKGMAPQGVAKTIAYANRGCLGCISASFVSLGIFTFTFLYLFIAWRKAGIDPPMPTIVAAYEAPEGISGAMAGYIRNRGRYDKRLTTASIVHLCVKGFLSIQNTASGFLVERKKDAAAPDTLPEEESALLENLLPGPGALRLGSSEARARLKRAAREVNSILKSKYLEHAKSNSGYLYPAAFAAAVSPVAAVFVSSMTFDAQQIFLYFLAAVLSAAATWCFFRSFGAVKKSSAPSLLKRILPASAHFGAGAALTVAAIFATKTAVDRADLFDDDAVRIFIAAQMLVTFLFAAALLMFRKLLRAQTVYGQKMSALVEGFARFIESTTDEEFRKSAGPRPKPRQYERQLPYAIAFGLEQEWSKRFNEAVSENSVSWYLGKEDFSARAFTSSIEDRERNK
ncbi:MAG: DUF2207 domain-containing protein [Deltaproteobacteria bacterium]|nr:DUF2207 domain-containing protein [Deltaproteobacteria bacterium]